MELEFIKNTIDPNNQMSTFFYKEGDDNASLKVMFIGNSITIHELKPNIGWNKTCGMAATDLEHDYVHVVYKHLLEKHKSVSICVCNGGYWETDYKNHLKAATIIDLAKEYKPDIIVLRIGENFNKEYLKEEGTAFEAFDYLIKNLKNCSKRLITTSLFWAYEPLDKEILKAAEHNKIEYINIVDLSKDKTNEAIGEFKNQSICLHPNNKGMKEIALRIIGVLDKEQL